MDMLFYKPKIAYRSESIRLAIDFAVGLIVIHLLNIQFGTWILFTIAILYFAGAFHGFVMQRLNKRAVGIVIGLILGIICLNMFSYNIYWFLYLSPIFFFFGFYSFFLTQNNYFYLAMFLALYFLLIATLQTPVQKDVNLLNLVFSRFACTVFAIIIVVVVEVVFISKSTLPRLSTLPFIDSIVLDFKNMVSSQNKLFLGGYSRNKEGWDELFEISMKLNQLNELVKNISSEFCFIAENEERYKKIFMYSQKIFSYMGNMVFLSSNRLHSSKQECPCLKNANYVSSKELIRQYIIEDVTLDKKSQEYQYLKNLHEVLWSLERTSREIELIRGRKG